MVMDKGLSIEEAKSFMSVAHPHVDIVKLGFGTAFVTPNLREKIEIYQSYDLPVYFGGTLFEAFLIRNQFDDYIAVCKEYGITHVEVREGLVQEILTQIPAEKILWEAPQKAQQLYFIELIGCNVNLGNIAPSEVIAMEAMRIGLRGDTFHMFLDKVTSK